MGGAIAVHTASSNLIPSLVGIIVIDVVEGTHFCIVLKNKIYLPPANEVCEGYVFTGVCLSTGWISVQGGSLSRGGLCPGGRSLSRGVSVFGESVQGDLCLGVSVTETPPPITVTCGWYASCGNAFL